MLKTIRTFLLLALCWQVCITPEFAGAETITSIDSNNKDSKLFRYVNAYIIASSLYVNAVNINQKLNFECNQPYEILPGKMTILQPIVFRNEKIHPVTGIWSHHYTLTRCNRQVSYNVYIIAANGEHPKFVSGLNGDTRIPLSSLIEVSTAAYKYANDNLGKCANPNPFINNTNIIHTDFETQASWQERWEIKICDEVKFLKVALHSADNKLTYKIEPDSIYTVNAQ